LSNSIINMPINPYTTSMDIDPLPQIEWNIGNTKNLIESTPDFNIDAKYTITDQATLLFFASGAGNLEIVKYLVDLGANMDICDKYGFSPLHITIHNHAINWLPIANYLLDKGANPNGRQRFNGKSPLHAAIGTGNIDLVRKLVEHGADINHIDIWGNTPLFEAGWKGDMAIAEYLLEVSAERNIEIRRHVNNNKKTAVGHARMYLHPNVAQLIKSYKYVPVKGVHCG